MYRIELYDGSQQPANRAMSTQTCGSESEARKVAAKMLGHRSLRGAATWDRYQGGTVYQFGPRSELMDNDYDFVVIVDEEADDEQRRQHER